MEKMNTTAERLSEQVRDKKFMQIALGYIELKDKRRWSNGDRTPEDKFELKESVMDHVGGLSGLNELIFSKAEAEGDESISSLNYRLVQQYIVVHDSPEAITGDIREKTEQDLLDEDEAVQKTIAVASQSGIEEKLAYIHSSYQTKSTPEALYMKGLDEFEAHLTLLHSENFSESKFSFEEMRERADKYTKEFKTLNRLSHHVIDLLERKTGGEEMSESDEA